MKRTILLSLLCFYFVPPFAQSTKVVDSLKLLLQKEAISQEEYDVARADLKSAQAQSQLISAQIAKTSVRAPFSGKIGLISGIMNSFSGI